MPVCCKNAAAFGGKMPSKKYQKMSENIVGKCCRIMPTENAAENRKMPKNKPTRRQLRKNLLQKVKKNRQKLSEGIVKYRNK